MNPGAPGERQLAELFEALVVAGSLPREHWPLSDTELSELGLEVAEQRVLLPKGIELLEAEAVMEALDSSGREWLHELRLHRVIGSTNSELRELALTGSVHGLASLAELQVAGRGRHGRQWFSPFAANLALSLGFTSVRPAHRLGGLSLAVGLAVLDAIASFGDLPLALKWPNDLLLGDGKLGGILVELVPGASGLQLVVGIGLNLGLGEAQRRRIDQPTANLYSALNPSPGFRSRLAGRLISSVAYFVRQFDDRGFAPMRAAFDQHHYHQGRSAQVLHGDERRLGVVRGVTDQGELLLETDGELLAFAAGEVSLREA